MRRGVLALVMVTTLLVSHADLEVAAKATDAIGQDPTARYDDGRGTSLRYEYIHHDQIFQPFELQIDPHN
jgi:hypothetical protein